MSDPSDPGPDWWPTFSLWQALRWIAEGILIAIGYTIIVFLVGVLVAFIFYRAESIDRAFELGKWFVIAGVLLSGGALSGPHILTGGLKWRTSLRLLGLGIYIVSFWMIIDRVIFN